MTRLCTTPGCTNKYMAKGLCRKCYDALPWRRAQIKGTPEHRRRRYRNARDRMTPEQKAEEAREAREWYRAHSTHRPRYLIGPNTNNTSGYRGVQYHKHSGLWKATLSVRGTRHSLGYQKTKEDAARAYNAAVDKFFPDTPHYKNPISSQEGL